MTTQLTNASPQLSAHALSQLESMLQYNEEKVKLLDAYAHKYMPHMPYHNYEHVLDVVEQTKVLCQANNLSPQDTYTAISAMYLHDVVQLKGAGTNEEQSAAIAGDVMKSLGYDASQIELAKRLIIATIVTRKPADLIEGIVKDADTSNLGRETFFANSEKVRREVGVVSVRSWYESSLRFLHAHEFYTPAAKTMYASMKEQNVQALESLLAIPLLNADNAPRPRRIFI